MGWMNTGFESMEDAYENVPKTGGGGRRVWIPPEKTSRFLFLDEDPTTFWEHQFFFNGSWQNWEPCHVRNKIGPVCPICDSIKRMSRPSYPRFVGLFTVIRMDPWFTKQDKIEMCFGREIFAANMGSKDKPGVLKKLERVKGKYGRLKGMCFDVYRSGAKTESCGDEFDRVEELCVDPTDEAIQALRDKLLPPYIERRNEKSADDKKVDMEKLLKWAPWESINFEELVEPRTVAELNQMGFGHGKTPPQSDDGGSKGSGGSDSKDDFSDDDDVPY